MTTTSTNRTDPRRALEALRNGVPNRDAVQVVGCHQEEPELRFLDLLSSLAASPDGPPPQGLLVAGDFGTGKSHLLEYLQDLAVQRNFVCSRVVISKETPLYDLAKVFRAAVQTAEVPGVTGAAVSEVALKLKPNSQRYVDFYRWAHTDESGLAPLFPATLKLYEEVRDEELSDKITNFWAGEKIAIADVRAGLGQIGEKASYAVRTVKVADLAWQRFAFVSRLIRAAGFAGWVILIDEVELVGRYTILQRGRSYAELARWLGLVPEVAVPGCGVVATITNDFDLEVLGQKGDRENIGPKLQSKGTPEYALVAARAEAGMAAIEHDPVVLQPLGGSDLRRTYELLRSAHGQAYDWDPPDVWDDALVFGRMRNLVRGWITRWDLARIYPGRSVNLDYEEISVDYREDKDLEAATEESPDSQISG